MNRLLITGATGFIGEPCVRTAEQAYSVCAVSRSQCNLLAANEPARIIAAYRPTHLIHLAWIATPGIFWESPANNLWFEASRQLLRAFAHHGGVRAVLVGSCAEYDWSKAGVMNEHTTPTAPRTLYGRCKLKLAQWAERFARESGLSIAWARLFWMYGPREHPARLVPSIARSLLAGLPAECTSGEQLRDFLHVNDVAGSLVALLDSDATGIVNIGSGVPIPVHDIVLYIANACGRPDLVRFGLKHAPPDDPPAVIADTARLREEVRWRPRIDLEAGLRDVVNWWRASRAA